MICFENLQPRVLFAGNVSTELVDGTLFIRGDADANSIIIDQAELNAGEMRIRSGDNETLIDETFEAVIAGVTGDIRIQLRDGRDSIVVQDIETSRGLRIYGGERGDSITVRDSIIDQKLIIKSKRGNDRVHVNDTIVEGESLLGTGQGADVLSTKGSTFEREARIRTREDNDSFFRGGAVFNGASSISLGAGDDTRTAGLNFSFDFNNGIQGWRTGFADTFGGNANIEEVNFKSAIRDLPEETGEGQALRIAGTNITDDLFMFLRRKLDTNDGITPNARYFVQFEVTFASNGSADCLGVGGSPGSSIFLKTGASGTRPQPVFPYDTTEGGMNIDIGDQLNGGRDASVAGDIDNGLPCPQDDSDAPFASVQRKHVHTSIVQADADGNLHLLIGTDSGFEARTVLYYQQIDVTLIPAPVES